MKSKQDLMDEIDELREIAFDLYRSLSIMTKTVDYNSLDIDGDVGIAEEAMDKFNEYTKEKL
jgi:hypothetical protein